MGIGKELTVVREAGGLQRQGGDALEGENSESWNDRSVGVVGKEMASIYSGGGKMEEERSIGFV
jgi:hypothetical protein